ncbi:MAG: fibronectin type III domain-containing protein [Armatimonadota bacterium]|nr:fibronectin type III domain-containing protein [bacterium]
MKNAVLKTVMLLACLVLFAAAGTAFASQQIYQAESALSHNIGRSDGDGWSASILKDSAGYLCYGPNTTQTTAGMNCASFRMMIDYRSAATGKIVRLEAYDATTGLVIATREVCRYEFLVKYTYQNFALNFSANTGHSLEFRVYWYDAAYIKLDCVVVTSQAAATLDDYWAGNAVWTQLATEVPMDNVTSGYQMIYPSMVVEGDEIWAYYMGLEWYMCQEPDLDQNGHQVVNRARSSDGINWVDDGIVLHIGGYPAWTFQAENLYHGIGRAEGVGWSANTTDDSAGYLCYGPYTNSITAGPMEADFVFQIDDNTLDSSVVVSVDVYDATAGAVLASRSIGRKEFKSTGADNYFHLNFTSPGAGHYLEFRTYWYDKARILQNYVGIAEGSFPHSDNFYAAYAGIYKESGIWYLVYEACGYTLSSTSNYALGSAYTPSSSSWSIPKPQTVELATSTDGLNFVKSANNPVLVANSTGWERNNVGTPTLQRTIGGDWLLYYHGYGPSGQGGADDCQIGYASGSNLFSLTKSSSNPVIPTVADSNWESGTTGKRSQIIQAPSGHYYMAYEGSTDATGTLGFNAASWSTGLARSLDKLSWTKYSNNPMLPIVPTNPGETTFQGNNGCEMVVFNGVTYLYVMADFTHEAIYRLDNVDTTGPTVPGTPTDAGAYTTDTSLTFNWTPSTDDRSGVVGYNCQIGTSPGASDVFSGYLVNTLSTTVTGSMGNTYYCRVQAMDNDGNLSDWSGNSDGIAIVEQTGIDIATAKGLARSKSVGLASKSVSALFSDYFYIQESNRSAGIMVKPASGIPAGLAVGNLVNVGGIIAINSNYELYIDAAVLLLPGTTSIKPLGLANKAIGGSDFQYSALPEIGQIGITGAHGLNNIGLLVQTWGRVSQSSGTSFFLDDGSSVSIKVVLPNGASAPADGKYVKTTGVSSCYVSEGKVLRQLLVRDASEVVEL